ncbi:MAG: sulfotransferase family protein [Candidatus Nanopelagicales bacterium]|nr:sulfotransferase family protein [Candidatus Nanopelagicales bacterium]
MGQVDSDPYVRHSLRTAMFFPTTRLFVVGNPKAAGTTLRWWLLAAHGVDVGARTASSWWSESAPFQTVWDPGIDLEFTWGYLSARQREDALTAPDVLTVKPVRHPVSRLFSAWAGKYLVGEPYYTERLPTGFPMLPATLEDEQQIGAGFDEFVIALRELVEAEGFGAADVHFWPQHRLLARPPAGTTLVLRQEAMGEGLASVAEHLAKHGLPVGPAPRINETVVPYHSELISDRALDAAVSLYEDDFAVFGYDRRRPESSSRPVDLQWLNDVRGRNARYGVLHRALNHLRDENSRLQGEVTFLRGRERELLDSTSWKVTAPLRWVSDKTKR